MEMVNETKAEAFDVKPGKVNTIHAGDHDR